jgi:hypothetical protein
MQETGDELRSHERDDNNGDDSNEPATAEPSHLAKRELQSEQDNASAQDSARGKFEAGISQAGHCPGIAKNRTY